MPIVFMNSLSQKVKTKSILLSILISLSSSHSRPAFTASIENDDNIYLGIEYMKFGVRILVPPYYMGFIKYEEGEWAGTIHYDPQYGVSFTKAFDRNHYKAGIDWRFSYKGEQTGSIYEDFSGVMKKSTETEREHYINEFGYFISKEFGMIEPYFGGYINFDYSRNEKKVYLENQPDYSFKTTEMEIDFRLIIGLMLRI